MGVASGNSEWQNYPSQETPISAEALNKIEEALDDFLVNGGTPGQDGQTGQPGPPGQDAQITFFSNKASFPGIGQANVLYVAINPD